LQCFVTHTFYIRIMQRVVLGLIALFIFFVSNAQTEKVKHFCAHAKQTSYAVKKLRSTANAAAQMSKYDVTHYHLFLNAQATSLVLSGQNIITARAVADLDSFCFELHTNHTVDSVVYNGVNLQVSRVGNEAYAVLPNTITTGNFFMVSIYYHGTAPSGGGAAIGNGYSIGTSPSWGAKVAWSLSQPYSAHEWWPCKQSLQDKADSSKVYITTADSNLAGSNGTLVGIDSFGNGTKTYKWHNDQPIAYYLISVAVSQYIQYNYYAKINNTTDSVLMQNFVYKNPNCLPFFKNQIDTIGLMMTWMDSLFTRYPFAVHKYGHCMAPFGGGMEHQTMTSIGAFNFDINAHELAHQWFGDDVTCTTWKDIWINEGFASYSEYLTRARFRTLASANNYMLNVHASVMDLPGGSVYTTDTSNVRVFDSRLSYDKGGAVIHTLRFILGDSLFFATLKTFLTQKHFSSASVDDFKTVAQTVSGLNLNNYFNEWIYGQGYPTYSGTYSSNGAVVSVTVNVAGSAGGTPLFTTPLQLRLKSASGDSIVRVSPTAASSTFTFNSAKNITGIDVDPNNWICNKTQTFTKLEVPPTGIESALIQNVSVYPNPADNNCIITLVAKTSVVSIIDAQGKVCFTQICQGPESTINTGSLANGNYILRVEAQQMQTQNLRLTISHP
jgi:aminopeptidase N